MGCVVSRTFQPFYSGKNSPLAIVQEEDLTADLKEKMFCPCQEPDHGSWVV
jgi:hypothetical protein